MAVAEAWETLKQAVEAYTGLSPASFFTVLALAAAIYYTVAGFFETQPLAPQQREREAVEREPLPSPVQLGEVSEVELLAYDGSDRKKPLLMTIKGQIYDVSQSRMFYGPGGPYALFAGKDASRALAKMSFELQDLTGDLSGLSPFELEALRDWENKFMSKYTKVGTVKQTVPVTVTEGSDAGAPNAIEKATPATENIEDSRADDAAQTKDVKAHLVDDSSEPKAAEANEN
ncbi:membrane steroid-binding protein 1-like [Zingiber officinale]|uniref:Cytochrome b5 heme-binding domain-containing protein n=1 Tax=Zingiber officinale TaxID=94328 RepID=A0A8J5I072_ZINOF|nr:membrane steroid-binding protein 1-like [Zingiber officinale]KAG6537747.1 hypothetical protein ZIOFF_002843 [Zingiber officinale]